MPKVMLVEDNETLCSLLKTIFELEGFEVSAQNRGSTDSLLALLAEFMPDVLLLDINFRNVNGLDLTRTVRNQFGKGIKVILSSGMPLEQESLAAGADTFLMKPFVPDEAIAQVNRLVH